MLKKLLVWDPKQRISAADALKHAYFDEYKDAAYEEDDVKPFDWSFMDQDLSVEEWKAGVIQVIGNLKDE